MNIPPDQRHHYVTRLIHRDEWKLICKIRQAETCRRKLSYPDKAAAYAEAIRISSQLDNGNPPSRPYACEICGKWHLTTKPLMKKKL